MVKRFDIAKIEKPKIDHNGYLQADAVLTRTGVFKYRMPDGSMTNELRPDEEVFNPDSLSTLSHRPVTDGHPIAGELTPKNTRELQRGMVISQPKRDGDLVRAKLLVTDQVAIDKIMRDKNPVRELSCGYKTDLVKESGEVNGQRYDHKQTNIVYNHVALVPRGRAGPVARLRIDAKDGTAEELELELQEEDACGAKSKSKEDQAMTIKIKVDRKQTASFKTDAMSIEVADEEAEAKVQPLISTLDSAIDHIKTLEDKNSMLQGRVDELVEKAELPPERLDELGQERADILGVAHYVGLENVEKLRNDEIKKAVVHKVSPDLKLDEVDQPYINGRYDSVVDNIKKERKGMRSLSELRQLTQPDSYKEDEDEDDRSPREAFKEDTQNWWMTKEQREQLN